MANLVELFDNIVQMQNLNGVPLANGKMYVYALGRTRLMDTWSDVDGESLNSNPIILDAAGQCHCYVTDDFDYTIVVTDEYNNEIFSIDKYLYSKGSHSHADVAVAPSETIAVSSYHVGECTIYVPYLTGQLGKVYEGIDPIVVNNTEDKISANHVPLGVQDPLYFVQDDEEGCIIGFSGQTVPEGVMTESALGFENDKITGYNGSAFSAGNEYEEGSYISIDNNTISVTGLTPVPSDTASTGLVAQVSADIVSQIPSTAGLATTAQLDEKLDKADSANFLLTSDSANFLLTSDSGNFLLTSDSGNFYPMTGNPSGFLTAHQSLDDYATKQWVEDKGYITGIDIQESGSWNEATTVVNNNSAIWNSTTETVSSNSAAWGSATPQIPVTGINGIKISESGDQVVFEVSGNYATQDWVTSQGYLTAETDWSDTITAASANAYNEATAAIPTGLATTGDLQTVSAEITALIPSTAGLATTGDVNDLAQSISETYQVKGDYLTTADSAEFYTTANESGFITGVDLTPYQLTADMTAYQPVGEYLTTADSAEFYTTANESGFITGVDLSDYQTTAGMTAYQPIGDYLQGSDLSLNSYNKISAISGHELAGGGGGSVDFDYDPDGNISGINNSAISDSRAGTPLYVEAPLFTGQSGDSAYIGWQGYNETKLWVSEGSGGSNIQTFNLNEPYTAFERIKIYFRINDGDAGCAECLTANTHVDAITMANYSPANTGTDIAKALRYYLVNDNQISAAPTALFKSMGATAVSHETYSVFYVQEIIGVNRKQV